eukprot:CAMPEP_0170549476 /NCGR_PEP_ID=MMETSP0211-20121228/7633_1 /TAXON_ID=311385 /ORGANISM="Pseudokeronopsis sp., Strain OXSARD2" /LENGTH=75 /DNA_ID=CAMNT_0010855519 /DNA_START=414 /DNA_END=638 /DNA_ORIENTATION=-
MLICAIYNAQDKYYLKIIDRLMKEVIVKVKNPAGNKYALQIVPIAHFDPESLPYVFIRDDENLTFYDIKDNKAHW